MAFYPLDPAHPVTQVISQMWALPCLGNDTTAITGPFAYIKLVVAEPPR